MSRNIISICLSILFLGYTLAPTILTLIDDSADVSMFYTASEEEEKKGSEKDKEIEILLFDLHNNELDAVSSNEENNLRYYFKKYPKPHLNLISPPPELHIL